MFILFTKNIFFQFNGLFNNHWVENVQIFIYINKFQTQRKLKIKYIPQTFINNFIRNNLHLS